ncbi:uncharacterized protein DSM5745_02322 [Aspergillus mulundensis]|uniref:Oxidase ustYa n=1 Tax=Aspergillus mulundensis TaxID=1810919 RepID=A0A3D8SW48_9EURO|nr:hypothetical protein DSM5745_02322 [Aspergillus mulundensis]RDW90547.1 hypothetical protein DSM5745_02322 [Aspergillus mulundensis]
MLPTAMFDSKPEYSRIENANSISSDDESGRHSETKSKSLHVHWGREKDPDVTPQPRASSTLVLLALITILVSGSLGGLMVWRVTGGLARSCAAMPSLSTLKLPMGTRKVIFNANHTFVDDPKTNPRTVDAWNSIMPVGYGGILLTPDQYPVTSNHRTSYKEDHWAFTVYHQIHCLYHIQKAYYNLIRSPNTSDAVKSVQETQGKTHVPHCIDYLRQSVLCSADTTLEPMDPNGRTAGWDTEHICADYAALMAWTEEHRSDDFKDFASNVD